MRTAGYDPNNPDPTKRRKLLGPGMRHSSIALTCFACVRGLVQLSALHDFMGTITATLKHCWVWSQKKRKREAESYSVKGIGMVGSKVSI